MPMLLIPYRLENKYLSWCLMFAFLTKLLAVSSGGCAQNTRFLRCPQTATLPFLWRDLTMWVAPIPAESSLQSGSQQESAGTVDGLALAEVSNLVLPRGNKREMPNEALIFMKASKKVPHTSLGSLSLPLIEDLCLTVSVLT